MKLMLEKTRTLTQLDLVQSDFFSFIFKEKKSFLIHFETILQRFGVKSPLQILINPSTLSGFAKGLN